VLIKEKGGIVIKPRVVLLSASLLIGIFTNVWCDNLSFEKFTKSAEKTVVLIKNLGTGFLYTGKHWTYLVTARHVLTGDPTSDIILSGVLNCSIYWEGQDDSEILPDTIIIHLKQGCSIYEKNCGVYAMERDIVAIKLAHFDSHNHFVGLDNSPISHPEPIKIRTLITERVENVKKFNEINVLDDVMSCGYPSSLKIIQNQLDPDLPVWKKCVVAQKNGKRRTIIIDGPVYHGNSGGPVYIADKSSGEAKLIGIAVQYVPYITDVLESSTDSVRVSSTTVAVPNSGYSVVEPIDGLIDIMEKYDE
jgi:hypothetical protein